MKYLFLFLLISVYTSSISQEDTTYMIVEEPPVFPGGEEGMIKYLTENLNISGIVSDGVVPQTLYLGFVIDVTGEVTDIKVLRSSLVPSIDSSAVETLKKMPLWKPGKSNGKEVRVGYTIPIRVSPR